MASDHALASAKDIARFSLIQWSITALFLLVVFALFGGTGAPYPPLWLIITLLVFVAAGAVLSERVWLSGPPMDPANGLARNNAEALERFANQTIRKLVYTEIPLLLTVLSCFIFDNGGWPALVVGLPGLAVQAFETWPHLRNISKAEAIFDSQGAETHLVESFR